MSCDSTDDIVLFVDITYIKTTSVSASPAAGFGGGATWVRGAGLGGESLVSFCWSDDGTTTWSLPITF